MFFFKRGVRTIVETNAVFEMAEGGRRRAKWRIFGRNTEFKIFLRKEEGGRKKCQKAENGTKCLFLDDFEQNLL